MRAGTQFLLLQYKHWKIQFRKKVVTFFQIIIPVLFCLLLVGIRRTVTVTKYDSGTTFPSYSIYAIHESLPGLVSQTISETVIRLAYTPNTTLVNDVMTKTQVILMAAGSLSGVEGKKKFLLLLFLCIYYIIASDSFPCH